jgi:subtilisin-like proprotein convertase family protein
LNSHHNDHFTMKFPILFALIGLAAGGVAQATTNVFQQTENVLIADANPTGFTSTNVVSGMSDNIQSVSVTLNFEGGYNGDLFAYLAYNAGYAVLLNRIGKNNSSAYGSDSSGLNLTLSDTAGTDIHLAGNNGGGLLTGSWQPDGRETDPQNTMAADARTAMLSSFTGLNPNGVWRLFVADMATGYQSTLANWSLTIVTAPEPTSLQLLTLSGGFALAGVWWRRRQQAKP